ncbi:MAG: hypothetical protein COV36_06575 [Alphaproteobacteria bacterium CG11_big_fil_rev_8_21_14_0_20_44_7]|nr:MAG: hypothetical protein COV36_06575 [Alphaproteobacteria bacterium CG11_big_fil_rev_8_21_14_0_20_44_7]
MGYQVIRFWNNEVIENIEAVLEVITQHLNTSPTPPNRRGLLWPSGAKAYFICVLSLAQPDGSSVEFEGRIDGTLTFPPRGKNGFGYDPIFIPERESRTFGEMSQLEKNKSNHRADAFDKFKKYLLKKPL